LTKRTNSQWLAIVIAGLFFVISVTIVYPSFDEWSKANEKLNRLRQYYISFSNTINILEGEQDINTTWQIDLLITQPHGTLITGDRVDISGKCITDTPTNYNITEIAVWFQNSQPYTMTHTREGMLSYNASTIHLVKRPNIIGLTGKATIKWEVEGTYSPIAQLVFENETGTHLQYLGISPDVAITVHPESEYAQTVNSNVTMILTGAVYLLTLVGTGDLLVHLWDREERRNDSQNNSKNGNNTTQPEDNLTNKGTIGENSNANGEIEQNQSKKNEK